MNTLVKITRSKFSNFGSISVRALSMHKIDKNLYLCTDEPRKIDIDQKTFKFIQEKNNKKPIILMLTWFYAQPNQINKYSKIYTDKGMDVLVGSVTLYQFLFDIKDVEKFGQNIAKILENNKDDYPEIFIHSFSAGGAMTGITQRMIKKDINTYGKIPERVIGSIWDSIAHWTASFYAIATALFPNNVFMRTSLANILNFYIKSYKSLNTHMNDANENFSNSLIRSPALIFCSKTDKIGTAEYTNQFVKIWRKNGVDVTLIMFDDSPHVKHFLKYPEIYMKSVHEHWEKVKLLERK